MNQDVIDRLIGEAQYLVISGIKEMATNLLRTYPEAITFVLGDEGICDIETESPTHTTNVQLYRDIDALENYVHRNRGVISGCRIVICKDEVI